MGFEYFAPIGPILTLIKMHNDSQKKVISIDNIYTYSPTTGGCIQKYYKYELINRSGGLSPSDFVTDFKIQTTGRFVARSAQSIIHPLGIDEHNITGFIKYSDDMKQISISTDVFKEFCNRGDKIYISFHVSGDQKEKPRVKRLGSYVRGCEYQERIGPLPQKSGIWLAHWFILFFINLAITIYATRHNLEEFGLILFVTTYVMFIAAIYYGLAMGSMYGLGRWLFYKAKFGIRSYRAERLITGAV